jgi:hypothetical protein
MGQIIYYRNIKDYLKKTKNKNFLQYKIEIQLLMHKVKYIFKYLV